MDGLMWHNVILWGLVWIVASVLLVALHHKMKSGQWAPYTDEQLDEKERWDNDYR
jgi:hypothetical protein